MYNKIFMFALLIVFNANVLYADELETSSQDSITTSVQDAIDYLRAYSGEKVICPMDPADGKRGSNIQGTATCCKDGFAYTTSILGSGYYGILPERCGCPSSGDGSEVVPGKWNTCCNKDGKQYVEGKGYDVPNPAACCPDMGTPGTDGETCCKDGHPLDENSGEYGGDSDKCCKENEEMHDGKCYKKCPEGQHLSKIFNLQIYVCCSDGMEAGKNASDGCCDPQGNCCPLGEIRDDFGNCCMDDNAFVAKKHDGTMCCDEGIAVPYIREGQTYTTCCTTHGSGTQLGADSDGQCCERGMASDGQSSTCCDVGEHSETYLGGTLAGGYSKCCKDNEIMGPKGECCVPGTEECCAEGEYLTDDGKCERACSSDKPYFYCNSCHECPSDAPILGYAADNPPSWWQSLLGTTPTTTMHWDGTCHECPTGTSFSCEAPNYCACPPGGFMSLDSSKVCCSSEGKSLDADGQYTVDDPKHCGCPEGATLKEGPNQQAICCKDGWVVNSEDESIMVGPRWCGCPEEGVSSKGEYDTFCCKDGQVADPETRKYVNPRDSSEIRACGCPDGGQKDESTGTVMCCKDGQYLDWGKGGTGTYRDSNDSFTIRVCGCPDGGEKDESTGTIMCCKDGQYLDWGEGGTGTYRDTDDSFTERVCGCPVGSVYCDEETGYCEASSDQ